MVDKMVDKNILNIIKRTIKERKSHRDVIGSAEKMVEYSISVEDAEAEIKAKFSIIVVDDNY